MFCLFVCLFFPKASQCENIIQRRINEVSQKKKKKRKGEKQIKINCILLLLLIYYYHHHHYYYYYHYYYYSFIFIPNFFCTFVTQLFTVGHLSLLRHDHFSSLSYYRYTDAIHGKSAKQVQLSVAGNSVRFFIEESS